MKTSTIPISCSLALATLSGAVFSHWWSLREFTAHLAKQPDQVAPPHPVAAPPAPVTQPTLVASTAPAAPTAPTAPPAAPPAPAPTPDPRTAANQPAAVPVFEPTAAQKEFYESLLDEIKQLKQTNVALRDQMAETNRDLMKLEFRVDTQSASFRPLPVTEELSTLDTSSLDTATQGIPPSDLEPGVLPPRAVRIDKP